MIKSWPIYTHELHAREEGITMIALIARIVENIARSWALSGDLCVWWTGSLFNTTSISTRVCTRIGREILLTVRKEFLGIRDDSSILEILHLFRYTNDSDNAAIQPWRASQSVMKQPVKYSRPSPLSGRTTISAVHGSVLIAISLERTKTD